MDELDVEAEAFGATLLVHEAGHVGGNEIFGAGAVMVLDLVVAHFSRNRLLEHRKRAAEAAAFIGSARGRELDASHLTQESGLEKNGSSISEALAVRSVVQALCSPTLCGNSAHGNSSTFHYIVQKLDQLVGAAANLLDRRCLRDCVEMFAHVVGTAARWVTMVSNSRKFARPPTWLVLEVEVAEGLSVIVAGNEAGARCFLRSTRAAGSGARRAWATIAHSRSVLGQVGGTWGVVL